MTLATVGEQDEPQGANVPTDPITFPFVLLLTTPTSSVALSKKTNLWNIILLEFPPTLIISYSSDARKISNQIYPLNIKKRKLKTESTKTLTRQFRAMTSLLLKTTAIQSRLASIFSWRIAKALSMTLICLLMVVVLAHRESGRRCSCYNALLDEDLMPVYCISDDELGAPATSEISLKIFSFVSFLRLSLFSADLLFLYSAVLLQRSVLLLGLVRCRRKIHRWNHMVVESSRRAIHL